MLADLGLDEQVCDFIDATATDKEQREYIRWLTISEIMELIGAIPSVCGAAERAGGEETDAGCARRLPETKTRGARGGGTGAGAATHSLARSLRSIVVAVVSHTPGRLGGTRSRSLLTSTALLLVVLLMEQRVLVRWSSCSHPSM